MAKRTNVQNTAPSEPPASKDNNSRPELEQSASNTQQMRTNQRIPEDAFPCDVSCAYLASNHTTKPTTTAM